MSSSSVTTCVRMGIRRYERPSTSRIGALSGVIAEEATPPRDHRAGSTPSAGMRTLAQSRVSHARHVRASGERLGHALRVGDVALHAQAERTQATQHEVAIERPRDRSTRVLQEEETLVQVATV